MARTKAQPRKQAVAPPIQEAHHQTPGRVLEGNILRQMVGNLAQMPAEPVDDRQLPIDFNFGHGPMSPEEKAMGDSYSPRGGAEPMLDVFGMSPSEWHEYVVRNTPAGMSPREFIRRGVMGGVREGIANSFGLRQEDIEQFRHQAQPVAPVPKRVPRRIVPELVQGPVQAAPAFAIPGSGVAAGAPGAAQEGYQPGQRVHDQNLDQFYDYLVKSADERAKKANKRKRRNTNDDKPILQLVREKRARKLARKEKKEENLPLREWQKLYKKRHPKSVSSNDDDGIPIRQLVRRERERKEDNMPIRQMVLERQKRRERTLDNLPLRDWQKQYKKKLRHKRKHKPDNRVGVPKECGCRTKAGKPCRLFVLPGSRRCHLHAQKCTRM